MLLIKPYFFTKKGQFVLFFKSLFVYFDYFIFLSIFRVFSSMINNIKLFCNQFKVFSSFFSAKILSVIFLGRSRAFLASSGLVLYSNISFSSTFLKALIPLILLKATFLTVLAKGYFLNMQQVNLEQLFLFYEQVVEKPVYFYFVIFFISNFFLGLFFSFNIKNLIRLNF